jgi:hypothetical protein
MSGSLEVQLGKAKPEKVTSSIPKNLLKFKNIIEKRDASFVEEVD